MAVYYKWIKGCEPGSTLDSGLWSYISWGKLNNWEKIDLDRMPRLKVSKGKQDNYVDDDNDNGYVKDLGYFLTNKMPSPTIEKRWTFASGFDVGGSSDTGTSKFRYATSFFNHIQIISDQKLGDNSTSIAFYKYNKELGDSGYTNTAYISYRDYEDGGKLILRTAEDGSSIDLLTKTKVQIFGGFLSIPNNCCEAEFFNATSDKRAKENIQPATYSALDLISKLPVYIFNYKNKDETVTGILAQDLLEAQPKELDLVSNVNATGENNDYMSIKNDKLMFVLMKAIQEQQAQIEKLEKEIEYLKQA